MVSPIGMNIQVLSMGDIGLSAKSQDEWADALLKLLSLDESEREKMGLIGRHVVEQYFSTDVIAPLLAAELKKLVS